MEGGRFAAAFRAVLEERGTSLGSLRRSLEARGTPVSLATLSYWRSGQREPVRAGSLQAVAEIEQILSLAPGELEVHLRSRRHRVDPHAMNALSDAHQVIRRLLDELGFASPSDDVIDRAVTVKYDLDDRGSPRRCTYVVVVEALHSRAERRATVLQVQPEAQAPRITPLGGYRLGRVRHDPGSGIVVGEMVLDRVLLEGETALLEQQLDYAGDDPDDNTYYYYWAIRRMRSVSLWIRFHPDRMPSRVESYTILDGAEEVVELDTFGTSVSRTLTDFGPGTLGFRWYWD